MHVRLAPLALAGHLLACQGGADTNDRPPPVGTPWLARSYDVTVSLLGTDCDPGGLEAVPLAASAVVRQDETTLSWIQKGYTGTGGQWGLAGRLCPVSPDATEPADWSVRLAGGRIARIRSSEDLVCRVEMVAPAGARLGAVPGCADEAIDLAIDPCGVLTAAFDVAVTFGEDCSRARSCTLRLRWQATPIDVDPRTPLDRRLICTESEARLRTEGEISGRRR